MLFLGANPDREVCFLIFLVQTIEAPFLLDFVGIHYAINHFFGNIALKLK